VSEKQFKTFLGSQSILKLFERFYVMYSVYPYASRPGRFTSRERAPGTLWSVVWVDPRFGLDAVVKRKIPSSCRFQNPW